jgi:DNA-3-methyladenine glycosylase
VSSGPEFPEPCPEGARKLPGRTLPVSFYDRGTVSVAREILGCLLCRREDDGTYSYGRIMETEAYVGESDPACHAAAGRTPRTRVLYGRPGRAYVYFTYGMHYLFNCVTEPRGTPGAVLIRALRPEAGVERMARRRGTTSSRALASGPSKLCQALGIDLAQNELRLTGPEILIRRDGIRVGNLARGPRVGIRKGTARPWRFWVEGNPYVSRGRPGPPPQRVRSSGGDRGPRA